MQSVVLPSRCIVEQALERTRHEGSSCLRHELRFGTPRLLLLLLVLLLLCCCKLLHTKTTSGHAWILQSTSTAELFHMYRSSEQVHGYPKWKPRSIKKSGWETRGTRDPPSPPSVVVVFLLVLLGLRFLPSSSIQILKSFRDDHDLETSIRPSAPPSSLLHHPAPQKISGPRLGPRLRLLPSSLTIQLLKIFRGLNFETSVTRLRLFHSSFTIQILKSFWDDLIFSTSISRPQ